MNDHSVSFVAAAGSMPVNPKYTEPSNVTVQKTETGSLNEKDVSSSHQIQNLTEQTAQSSSRITGKSLQQPQPLTLSKQVAEQAIDDINAYLKKQTSDVSKRELTFSLDEDTGRRVITVTAKTGTEEKIIRQIPPEETLRLLEFFLDMGRVEDTGVREQA
jgi:uncharacterized FlaG/YvyC family protein